ncbi:hypothetical protein FRC01_001193 [Tulasnella sp. 417]|nr:hypothetical protein FRC01_001193 [Tulasnella sp. 417]
MDDNDTRLITLKLLRNMGHMYQSRGEHARAFVSFIDALQMAKRGSSHQALNCLRDLIELARSRDDSNETIALCNTLCNCYDDTYLEHLDDIAEALHDLVEMDRHPNEALQLPSRDRTNQGQERMAKTLCNVARNLQLRKRYEKAMELFNKALETSTYIGDVKGRADALLGLAKAHQCQRQYRDSARLYSEGLEILTDFDDSKGRVNALWGLAESYQCQGQYMDATRPYSEALEILTDLGNEEGMAETLWNLAEVNRLQEKYDEAIRLYHKVWEGDSNFRAKKGERLILELLGQVYRIRRQLHSEGREPQEDERIAQSLYKVAKQHRLQKRYKEAIPVYSQALEIYNDLGDPEGRANALWGLAEAQRYQGRALEIHTTLGDKRGRADALWDLAEVHWCRIEYEKVIALYTEVLKIRTDLGDERGRANALWGLADVHRCRIEYEKAAPLYSEALKLCECDKAIPLYSQALEIRTDLDDKEGKADALWGLAEVDRCRGEYDKAIPLYFELSEIHTSLGARKGRPSAPRGLANVH